MNKNLEIRNFTVELRADKDSRNVHGLAIPVEARSFLLGDFYEVVSKTALTEETITSNDIKLYLDHDPSHGTFARSKFGEGSLKLTLTERGLEFSFDAPNTVFGDALLEGIARGDYDSVSFAFMVADQHWDENGDGTYTRTILSYDLIDEISILSQMPAYPQTTVATRSLDTFKEEIRAKEEAEKQAELEKQKQESLRKLEEIEEDFNNLYKNFLNLAY